MIADRAYWIRWTCIALIGGLVAQPVRACTNFLITKGASADGSCMITYAADAHVLYGELYHTPAARHLPGAMLDVYEWDTGKFLGQIKQVEQTYNVVGNMNQHQVAIGETTWGGRHELQDPKGIIDYGSMIYIALQRAKTAREAIDVMVSLVSEYGYYSSGESLSVSDPDEVWLFEIIGKGPEEKGAVWVARKVPDGYITAHANNPRIRQFPLSESETTIYAPDVISFARKQGYFDGDDADFSFADTYGPLDYGAVRFCDARVWAMFNRAAPSMKLSADWVQGVEGAERIPLWVKPDKKLTVHDVMELMRDHFEGTPLDMTADIGAGPYDLPYRWRPLTWKNEDVTYFNERATSTQQTGFSFVAQSRSWLPDSIGGVLWFGVDDTYSTVYTPMYCNISRVPHSFAVGTGSFKDVTFESAFWVFNQVSNFAYLRYRDMINDIQIVQRELEGRYIADQPAVDQAALALHEQSPRLAVDYLTEYSVRTGDQAVERWRALSKELLYKYLDGNVKDANGNVTHPGYPESWYERVAKSTGSQLAMRKLKCELDAEDAKRESEMAKRQQLADGILTLLHARSVEVDQATKDKIHACEELEKLQDWLVQAATIDTDEELFAQH